MPSIRDDQHWDLYEWPKDGDEWADQAEFSGVPYPTWKQDLVDCFLLSNIPANADVLEIGVGHGRWTPYLSQPGRRYTGIDTSRSCVEYCRKRFADLPQTRFHKNDGSHLMRIRSGTVDFVWSFDTFVHIDEVVTATYLGEIARVLSPTGRACIHHPGAPDQLQRKLGWRSALTAVGFRRLAHAAGLTVVSQTDSWGPHHRSNTRRWSDCITTLQRTRTRASDVTDHEASESDAPAPLEE